MPPVGGRMVSRRQRESESAVARQRSEDDAAAAASAVGSGGWEQEMEDIIGGTHPQLVAELEAHEKVMKGKIAQADAVRQRQIKNISNLYECEKKRVEDEYRAQLEFFESTLSDEREEENKGKSKGGRTGPDLLSGKGDASAGPRKSARRAAAGPGLRARPSSREAVEAAEAEAPPQKPPSAAAALQLGLDEDEASCDLDEILQNVDHYSARAATLPNDELRSAASGDVWFDRSRQIVHCNGHALERGDALVVYQQGERVDQSWTLTAMNAVEVTLRDDDGSKFKVTLSQLRNGRYALTPKRGGHDD